jgi:hypothetical protein
MLKEHAKYEDQVIHELLRRKNSTIHLEVEDEHHHHEETLTQLKEAIESIFICTDAVEKLKRGYNFYLAYRLFIVENLKHLYKEETIIMSELQRLYTDEELKEVEYNTYKKMAPEHMVGMMEVLFNHMDINDFEEFLTNMRVSEPEKFKEAWPKIANKIDEKTQNYLLDKFGQ